MLRTLRRHSDMRQQQGGFTIVELLVVMTIMGVLIGLVFTTMNDLYQSNVRAIAMTAQTSDTRSALGAVEESLTLASGMRSSYTPAAAPLGPDNGDGNWRYDYGAGDTRTLIVQSAASKTAVDGSRTPALNPNLPCSAGNDLVFNTLIFFVKDGTLYRRTLHNNACTVDISQRQTCAISAASNSLCQGTDARLLENVTKFSFEYYERANDLSATPITDGSEIDRARAVDVTIETTRRINGKDNVAAASTRVVVDNRTN